MSDDDSDGQRHCSRRGVDVHELDAAMALADMAGVGPADQQQQPQPPVVVQHALAATPPPPQAADDDEDLASTRLSLELGKVGIQSSSPCSSSSSAGHHHHPAQQQQQQQQQQPMVPAAATAAAAAVSSGYGARPRHMLTEAEKEAKRLRRVLANRESARQTILRRQAIRDELARKVADLSSQNESMKKEKDLVMQEYLSLKEANKLLKKRQQVGRTTTTKKKSPATRPVSTSMRVAPPLQQAAPASPAPTTAVPVVPYVWGSWPPTTATGYDQYPPAPAGLPCLPPCAWYYPVVADPTTSPAGCSGAGTTAEEEGTADDDDPCSLTLAIDVDKRSAPVATGSSSSRGGGGTEAGRRQIGAERDKAATAAEARKRRKEVTKLKHMHAAGRPGGGGEQW